MRKLFAMVVIGLGLVVGFGFSNEVYACDDCVSERIETEEHEDCVCGSFQLQCENCGGLYCQEYACECGRCEGIIEEDVVMTYEEVMQFECYVWNELYMKSCVNYCEECDIEYYEHCSCECRKECEESGYEFTPEDEEYCWDYDYQLFIEDNYDMIMDIYEDIMNQLEDYRIAKEREETVIEIYEF